MMANGNGEDSYPVKLRGNVMAVATYTYNFVIRAQQVTDKSVQKETLPDLAKVKAITDVITALNAERILRNFFEYSWPCWDKLLTRDKEALLTSIDSLLPGISSKTISTYKILFDIKNNDGTSIVRADEFEDIWNRFQMMVRQCIEFGLQNINSKGVFVLREEYTDEKTRQKVPAFTIAKEVLLVKKEDWAKTKKDRKPAAKVLPVQVKQISSP